MPKYIYRISTSYKHIPRDAKIDDAFRWLAHETSLPESHELDVKHIPIDSESMVHEKKTPAFTGHNFLGIPVKFTLW